MERGSQTNFPFPAGFRFHPSDEELIVHYLQPKVTSRPLPASVIAEIDLYKYHPWDLPQKALIGEDEWYFFSPRDRKYPNGLRPNRAAASGYWKATGTDKAILTSSGSKTIGVKKALVFYVGRPPTKTDWMMDEYRLPETMIRPSRLKRTMRLDDWVLCRVRQKGNNTRNIQRAQDPPKPESMRYLMQVEDSIPATANANDDNKIFTDPMYKHCVVLTSLLTGQPFPPIDTTSQCASPQELYNSCYEEGSGSDTSPMTVPSVGSFINPVKGKEINGYPSGNHLPSKRSSNVTDYSLFETHNMLAANDMDFGSEFYYEAEIFTPSPTNMDMTPEYVTKDGYLQPYSSPS